MLVVSTWDKTFARELENISYYSTLSPHLNLNKAAFRVRIFATPDHFKKLHQISEEEQSAATIAELVMPFRDTLLQIFESIYETEGITVNDPKKLPVKIHSDHSIDTLIAALQLRKISKFTFKNGEKLRRLDALFQENQPSCQNSWLKHAQKSC